MFIFIQDYLTFATMRFLFLRCLLFCACTCVYHVVDLKLVIELVDMIWSFFLYLDLLAHFLLCLYIELVACVVDTVAGVSDKALNRS